MSRAARKKSVAIDLTPLRRFQRRFSAGMDGAPGPVDDFFKQAGARYLTFVHRRYGRYSRGGGDWPPLAASTRRSKRRRRRRASATGPRAFAILIDTGTLRRALLQGAPGNVFRRIRNGIRVGIGGGTSHPSGPLTIGRLAEIHNEGLGNVPQREIVPEELDDPTRRGIRSDLERAIARLGRQVERG